MMKASKPKKPQGGFMLLEATMAVAIFGMAILAVFATMTYLNRLDRGKNVGHQYSVINEALGQYMTTHYMQLKSLSPDCSKHSLGLVESHLSPTPTCTMTVRSPDTSTQGFAVINGLQPTVQELTQLGFLKAGVHETPALEVNMVVAQSDADGTVSTQLSTSRFFSVIEQRCVSTAVSTSLQGRYVLVRHTSGTSGFLALDEVEIIVNGANVAPRATMSQFTGGTYTDEKTNAAGFYNLANLVDGQTTTAQASSFVGNAYVLPGVFLSSSNLTPWVLFDLGATQTIASIGLRSANGTWATLGNHLAVVVSQEDPSTLGNNWNSLILMDNTRWAHQDILTPGIKMYLNAGNFTFKAPVSTGLLPTATGCPDGTMTALSSLVFNTQPFVLKDVQGAMVMLVAVVAEAGGDAAMSNPLEGGELQGNGGTFVLTNPVRDWRQTDTIPNLEGIGVGGIIAVRNGYASYSSALQVMADGSSPPTSDWQFGGKSLTNINHLASNSASVDNDLGVGGMLTAQEGKFNSAQISTSLTLPQRSVGDACVGANESLAQSASLILRCQANQWRSITAGTVNSQEYYEVHIKSIKATTPVTVVNYCLELTCQTSMPTEIPSAPTNADIKQLQTTLKTNEWFPVISGFSQTRVKDSFQSTSYTVDQGSTGWRISLYSLPNTEDANLKIFFYKINS